LNLPPDVKRLWSGKLKNCEKQNVFKGLIERSQLVMSSLRKEKYEVLKPNEGFGI
jgi:hypothetical protein